MIKSYLLFMMLFLSGVATAQISINEILADNEKLVIDPETGNYSDFIELYNSGASTADLSGFSLSDSPDNITKWLFPEGTTIAGNGYLIIWADNTSVGLHTNFKLNSSGETITLANTQGKIVSKVTFSSQLPNKPSGQFPEGSGNWVTFDAPTPGAQNTALRLPSTPTSSVSAGFYQSAQTVALTSPSGDQIYYTTDGSEPTAASAQYSEPLTIYSTAVVKATSFNKSARGKTLIMSIFIHERAFDLPIISLSTDPAHFFSDTSGIYVEGTNGITGRCMETPTNWNQDWERPISVEYFSPDGYWLIQDMASARIMGGCSRTNAQKSLTLVADDGRFDYPFFEDKPALSYKSLVLRNSGNDWASGYNYGTMLRDAFMQTLVKDVMDIDYQAYRPVVVFLNGEYWGMQNLREHLNEDYIANNHPAVDEKNIDLIKNNYDVKDGSIVAAQELMAFVEKNSLSDSANYAYVASQIDINEYVNYHLSQIYFANTDWPGNNVRVWKERTDKGQWRYILFDTDFGFGSDNNLPDENTLAAATATDGPVWPNPPSSTLLLRKLLENQVFKNTFIQQFAIHLGSSFTPQRIDSILYQMKSVIDNEIGYHLDRWYGSPDSKEMWEANIDAMSHWGESRQSAMMDILQEFFSLDSVTNLTLKDTSGGVISYLVQGARIKPEQADIACFPNIPIQISAKIKDGFLFDHWEDEQGNILSLHTDLVFTPNANTTIVAIPKRRPGISGLFINEVLASNKGLATNELGDTPDYIEIFNSSTQSVDLSGLYISDDAQNLKKFQLPQNSASLTIPAGGFLTLWANGKPEINARNIGWKIDKDGGLIVLTSYNGATATIIDNVAYDALDDNYSYGRYPDGEELELMFPSVENKNTQLSATAKLHNLVVNNMYLQPSFHTDTLNYTVLLSPNFPANFDFTAIPYGNATTNITATDELKSIEVVSEDGFAHRTYTIDVVSFIDIPNTLSSVAVAGGTLIGSLSAMDTRYTILCSSDTVPQITWTLQSNEAKATLFSAADVNDTTIITVMSPNRGERKYFFTYVTEYSTNKGYTHNFETTPSGWYASSDSHIEKFENGTARIAVDKTKEWSGMNISFGGELIDIEQMPYFQIGISSTETCTLRVDLNDSTGNSTNGVALSKTITAGKSEVLTYDFSEGFFQTWPSYADVNPHKIRTAWLVLNPAETGLKTEIIIDFIRIGDQVIFTNDPLATPKIFVSTGTLIPEFDSDIYEYSILNYSEIPSLFAHTDVQSVNIQYRQFSNESSKATVSIEQDGMFTRTYSFSLRPDCLSGNAFLSNIRLSNGALNIGFDPEIFEYTAEENKIGEISTIYPTVDDPRSSAIIYQAENVYQPSYIVVTAEDGTKQIYTIRYPLPISVTETQISISIYPNPTKDYFAFSGTDCATVLVYSLDGILQAQYNSVHENELIDIPQCKQDIYLVKICTGNFTSQSLLLVE